MYSSCASGLLVLIPERKLTLLMSHSHTWPWLLCGVFQHVSTLTPFSFFCLHASVSLRYAWKETNYSRCICVVSLRLNTTFYSAFICWVSSRIFYLQPVRNRKVSSEDFWQVVCKRQTSTMPKLHLTQLTLFVHGMLVFVADFPTLLDNDIFSVFIPLCAYDNRRLRLSPAIVL